MLQIDTVFINVSKGQAANSKDLKKAFGDKSEADIVLEVCVCVLETPCARKPWCSAQLACVGVAVFSTALPARLGNCVAWVGGRQAQHRALHGTHARLRCLNAHGSFRS